MFAAPTSDRLVRGVSSTGYRHPVRTADRWHRAPTGVPGNPDVRSLPPPPPDAVSSPGPTSWAAPLAPPTPMAAIWHRPQVADAVVGREVGDAFELIWPTGEVDGRVLDEPLAEPSGVPHRTTPPLLLRPLTAPPEVADTSHAGSMPDEVVLAVQHAIAAIGSDPAATKGPAPSPRSPEPPSGSVVPSSALIARTGRTDGRRSALKRLIKGLRRH